MQFHPQNFQQHGYGSMEEMMAVLLQQNMANMMQAMAAGGMGMGLPPHPMGQGGGGGNWHPHMDRSASRGGYGRGGGRGYGYGRGGPPYGRYGVVLAVCGYIY